MIDSAFSLAGKRILVTGGTRGIGRGISARFARYGARVIASYVRDDDAASALAAELGSEGLEFHLCRADLTTDTGLQDVVNAAINGGLSALVHCAATGVHRPIEQVTLRHWDFTFALNVRAFFALVHALIPHLEAGASIVGVSSQGAVQAVDDYGVVGASKGALEAFCRHLAVECAPRGIRVNVLSPGNILTDAWNAFPDKDRRLQAAVAHSPRGRLTTLGEVASAAHFLCCDASSGINGHTLVVDGGERVRGV